MGEMEDTVKSAEQANAEALKRLLAAEPVLTDVCPAGDVIAGLGERVMLHAGPPIEWQRMCGPLQSAVIGAGFRIDSAGLRSAPDTE